MKTKLMVLAGITLMLALGLTSAQAAPTGEAAIGAAEAVELCENQDPKGDHVGPEDGTRGENPPRDGRGVRRGDRRGPGRGEARGERDGQGRGNGQGEGRGARDGSGEGRGRARGGGERQGPRDGSGGGC